MNISLSNNISIISLLLNIILSSKLLSLNNTSIPTLTIAAPKFVNKTVRTNTTSRILGSFPFLSFISPLIFFISGSIVLGDISILTTYISVAI